MSKTPVELLHELLDAESISGAIIHKPENIRYLSGFTGEGVIALIKGARAIVTDFRYVEQAARQAPGWAVYSIQPKQSYDALACGLFESTETSVAFEDDAATVSQMRNMERARPDILFVPINQKPEKLREIKTDAEISAIERACSIACEAFESILPEIKPGRTEREIAWTLESAMIRLGADKPAFDTIAASGPNGSLPHAVPGARKLQTGEFLTLDFGAMVDGYCSDITRTVALGEVGLDKRRVYETTLAAQLLALDALRPGAACKEVDAIARDYINANGFEGRFGHGLGHSLGLMIHENPRFSPAADEQTLSPGHVMTVEPGIYRPGQDGVRIEDTVLITEDGYKRLTPISKELIIL
ncbi:MAG: aminopeptidase P family protein [Oscillospiraceae bacterium]|nr:aminopeptidase P family protein [Oscillospiraceae bacterium]